MASKDEENAPDFEYILRTVGTTGKLNKAIFVIASFSGFLTAMNTFSYGFLGATPPYWCQNDGLSAEDWTMEQRRNLSTPFADNKFDGCKIYDLDYSVFSGLPYSEAKSKMAATLEANNVRQIDCLVREFNTTVQTTVTQWDLVCERRWLYSTTQGVIQLGMLLGSGIVGFLTDRFGRKRMFGICTVAISFFGFCTIFSPNVWVFIFLRMFASVFGMGLYMSGFVLAVESSLPSQRSFTGNVFSVPWGIGVMILPGIAYLVRPWYYLQVALFVPTIFLFLGFWILPESPRWLIINGRYEEAYQVLKRIAKSNDKPLPEKNQLIKIMVDINTQANVDATQPRRSLSEKIRETLRRIVYIIVEPRFRRQSLIVFYCWFAVAIVYYGVSLGSPTPSEAGNAYLYMFLGGILEVISYIVLWPISEFFGRKKTLFAFYAICGVSILSALLLITFASNQASLIVLQWILFLIGKFAITAAFQLIWLFTAELYPTNYRSIAVGESSTIARAGSIFSSYINDLLAKRYPWIPAALFGTLSAIAAACILLLPETTKENLSEAVPKNPAVRGYDNPSVEMKE